MINQWELVYALRLPEPCILLHEVREMPTQELRKYRCHLAGMILDEIDHRPPQQPLVHARIHVERFASKPQPNYADLHGGLKQLTDVLCSPRLRRPYGLGFIVDDSHQFLNRLSIEARTVPQGQGYTIIQIFRPTAMALAA